MFGLWRIRNCVTMTFGFGLSVGELWNYSILRIKVSDSLPQLHVYYTSPHDQYVAFVCIQWDFDIVCLLVGKNRNLQVSCLNFYSRDAMLAWVLAVVVCLSVCLSVTRRYCVKTAKRRVTLTTPRDSPLTWPL